ncbi:MAG: DoxX family protein [Bacteroidia bacterium]
MTIEEKSSVKMIQTIFRLLLGAMLIYTGISHLTFARLDFHAQVPKWIPMNEDLVVILSGIVEIGLGSSLIFLSKYRYTIGWIVALFFVLIFPGNISQFVNKINAFGLNTDKARAIRLLFQPLFVIWALWSTGAWSAWRRKQSDKM